MDFKSKVALITGAGNGIGRASALGLAGGGALSAGLGSVIASPPPRRPCA